MDLYSNLSESEANEMLAILMSNGVAAEKTSFNEAFVLRVEEGEMVRAITILTGKGYPKITRQSIGSVFQKGGIISSPFEERVRYIYALGEEVAQTLSQIDGVLTARVHVVLPDQPQLGQPVKPSSAAVFIKHEPNVDLEFFVPQIRRLVSSSIEGMDYAAVTVVLTEALPSELSATAVDAQMVSVIEGLAVKQSDASYFWQLVYGALAFIVVLLAATVASLIALIVVKRRSRTRNVAPLGSGETILEPS
ncbi:type III secretion system inner membrane ring lipoprotein SctJ [Mesorhizobium sp. ANAO-SY3R2]|uniref:type III secretion system inner membrane ring lipoprotein SctJ n=1 Tax=Mesorhizobium sp. ANAO-SY3R2 TaxID=3166644 RepID=UPI0036719DDB